MPTALPTSSSDSFIAGGAFFRVGATLTGEASSSFISDIGLQEQYQQTATALIHMDVRDALVFAKLDDTSHVVLSLVLLATTEEAAASIEAAINSPSFPLSLTDTVVEHMKKAGVDVGVDTNSVDVARIDGSEFLKFQQDDDGIVMARSSVIFDPQEYATFSVAGVSTSKAESGLQMQAKSVQQSAGASRSIQLKVWLGTACAGGVFLLLAVLIFGRHKRQSREAMRTPVVASAFAGTGTL
jgi:hypothetical protein